MSQDLSRAAEAQVLPTGLIANSTNSIMENRNSDLLPFRVGGWVWHFDIRLAVKAVSVTAMLQRGSI